MKTKIMYQVREFVGNNYSKQIGTKLRTRQQAMKAVKNLKKKGKTVYAAQIKVAA